MYELFVFTFINETSDIFGESDKSTLFLSMDNLHIDICSES